MKNSKKDQNGKPTLICASNADGLDIVPIHGSPTNHGLCVDDNTTGSDNGNNDGNAALDENSVAVATALSSDDDGSIIEIYGDPANNEILIDSN